ncbi:MAG: AMP-dependent synthetase/ligase [Spirochaetia bacterium]
MNNPEDTPFTTLPGLLKYVNENYTDSVGFNYRKNDEWVSLAVSEIYEKVRNLALGLRDLGLERSSVGIIAPSSPFWVIADLAVLSSGNYTVPIFKRISPESMTYEIADSGTEYIFVGVESELEMVRKHAKGIKKIIPLQIEASGGDILDYRELLERGAEIAGKEPGLFEKMITAVEPEDLATIIYTSGSTGRPKGVELSQGNIVSQVRAAGERFTLYRESDTALSSLPLAHIFERMVMYFYLSTGAPVYFVDDLEKIGELIREVRPTIMTVVPRLLEKVYDRMRESAHEETGIRGRLARGGFRRAASKPVDEPFSGFKDFLYRKMVFPKLLEALGGRFRLIISGAAPLPAEVGQFFLNVGFPIFEGYGLTEASPVVAANYPGHNRLGTVGPLFPEVEVKIAEDGEVLARGPNVMKGYHNRPEETAKTIDEEGFLHTGDLGSLDDGYLTITGRKKELFKKSTGEYVAPVPIEQKLGMCTCIDMAMVVAERRKFVTAVVFPDFEQTDRLQNEWNMQGLSREEFLQSDELRNEIQKCIDEANTHLHHTEEVQKFTVVPDPPGVETGELTPTMKIKRRVIEDKYRKEIERLYEEEEHR